MNAGLPQDAVLARLIHSAFIQNDEELYLVGGAVRDGLLGEHNGDLDFATSALPEKTLTILVHSGLGAPHRIGEKFGTISMIVGGHHIEVTTYRAEQYAAGSRKPEVRFGTSLLDDLQRRDFTINAVATNPTTGEIIDPLGGVQDLRERTLRAVGNPRERFREDPLRLLRAVRFATRLGFHIQSDTWDAMCDGSGSISDISRERVRDEYEKLLVDPHIYRGMEMLRDSGLMAASIPQLGALTAMPDHGPSHPLSLWDHTMRVVAAVASTPEVRWSALLHDIGKPATRSCEPGGRVRFFHHEEIGARIAREVLEGLRYSNAFVSEVTTLIEIHMHLHAYSDEWSDGAVRRLVNRLGPLLKPAFDLVRADADGHSLLEPSYNSPKFDTLEDRIRKVSAETPDGHRSPLSGTDLMQRYGLPPGPWIRVVKDVLEDEVIEGRLAPDDAVGAWALADDAMERHRGRW